MTTGRRRLKKTRIWLAQRILLTNLQTQYGWRKNILILLSPAKSRGINFAAKLQIFPCRNETETVPRIWKNETCFQHNHFAINQSTNQRESKVSTNKDSDPTAFPADVRTILSGMDPLHQAPLYCRRVHGSLWTVYYTWNNKNSQCTADFTIWQNCSQSTNQPLESSCQIITHLV